MKKSFSLLEIIVVIVIVSILSTIAFIKFFDSINSANITKVKSEVAMINKALSKLYSKQILFGNTDFVIESLDEAENELKNERLFGGYDEFVLLDYDILATSNEEKKIASWLKISSLKYRVFFENDKSVDFIFDKDKGSFSCDKDNDICKKLEL